MRYYFYYVLGILLATTTCKQEALGPNIEETPVFSVNGILGSKSINLTAGVSDYYHFTNFDGQVSISTLSNENCPSGGCPNSLRFIFRRLNILGIDSIQIPYSSTNSQDFVKSTFVLENLVPYSFVELFQNTNPFYESVVSSSIGSPMLDLFPSPSLITMRGTRSNGAYGEITRTIQPFASPDAFPIVNMSFKPFSSDLWTFTATSNVNNPIYQWNNGETGSIIEVENDTVGIQTYSVTVTDPNPQGFGNIASATLSVLDTDTSSFTTPNFSFTSTQNIISDVIIQWVDSNGVVWSTDFNEQNDLAYFTIYENTSYEANEKGQKNRKVKIIFSCTMYSDSGEKQDFGGSGVIAIAYP